MEERRRPTEGDLVWLIDQGRNWVVRQRAKYHPIATPYQIHSRASSLRSLIQLERCPVPLRTRYRKSTLQGRGHSQGPHST